MPFHTILTDLVQTDDDTLGALFVDDSGELIGLACADRDKDRMELIAAYLPLYLQRLQSALDGVQAGAPRLIHIQRQNLNLHAAALPENYVLSLVTGPRGRSAATRRRLELGAKRLAREVDFIVMHAYAMWWGQSLDNAVAFTKEKYTEVAALHPEHQIVIGEAGWATKIHSEGEQAQRIARRARPVPAYSDRAAAACAGALERVSSGVQTA